ncbi:MAG: class I SAM-dependent methyltransferase [Parcubacteria group bacterium]|nr:class I SAM-dependent methyltransferase [Parcubacteria group bacterium]
MIYINTNLHVKELLSIVKSKLEFFLFPFYVVWIAVLKRKSLKSLLNCVVKGQGWKTRFIRSNQKKQEISAFLDMIQKEQPQRIMEIGTARGGTLLMLARIAAEDAKIISIDIARSLFGIEGCPAWRASLFTYFAWSGQSISILRKDSHQEETLRDVEKLMDGDKLDVLFIDGDHSYEGIKKDFDMYTSLVKSGGIVAFHDIVPGLEANVGGVPNFWQEIKEGYFYREFVKNWDQGGYGIGVIRIPEAE